ARVFADEGKVLVGITGFEPATSSSRTTRATNLRHIPESTMHCAAYQLYRRTRGDPQITGHEFGGATVCLLRRFGNAQQRCRWSAKDTHGRKLRGAQAIRHVHFHGAEIMESLHALAVDTRIGH